MPITLIQLLRRLEAEKEKEHNTMKKHEMTAREFFQTKHRMCREYFHNPRGWDDPSCPNCPIRGRGQCLADDLEMEKTIAIVAEWAAEHPEETLEPVGDGIYFDPKHRVVADELTEIYTFEVTYINENGGLRGITSEKVLKKLLDADDVKLIRRQHFITKCHEEEA